jgi:glycosyltransferase involved in cell wall biosynthesis
LLYDEHDHDVVMNCFQNNKKPLPVLYNECIDAAIADDTDWLVLCHNDLVVESNNLLERILEPKYDVVGLAGADNLQLKSPALWHLMAIPGSMRGAVAHNATGNMKHVTSFGPYPARCVIMDGLFLAINKKVFHIHRFDEENPASFHFYDLDFTLGAHHKGFKCGVGDILVTHQSPGLKEFTPEWTAAEKWFLTKYNT